MSDSIIKKIAALIAKANGTDNEHETDAFETKARELMAKYGISESDLDTDKIAHKDADFIISADLIWQNRLVWAVARYFNTVAVQRREYRKVYFILVGRDGDRATASMMFPYLLKEVRRVAAEIINGKSHSSNTRDVGLALAARLSEEAPEESEDLRKYIDDGMQTHKINHSSVKVSGAAMAAAKKINMSRQVNAGKKVKALA